MRLTWQVLHGGSNASSRGPARKAASRSSKYPTHLAAAMTALTARSGWDEWPGLPETCAQPISPPLCAWISRSSEGSPITASAGRRCAPAHAAMGPTPVQPTSSS